MDRYGQQVAEGVLEKAKRCRTYFFERHRTHVGKFYWIFEVITAPNHSNSKLKALQLQLQRQIGNLIGKLSIIQY